VKKRLSLKKVTLRDLGESALRTIAGGVSEAAGCTAYTNCNQQSCNGTCNLSCNGTCGGNSCQYTACGTTECGGCPNSMGCGYSGFMSCAQPNGCC